MSTTFPFNQTMDHGGFSFSLSPGIAETAAKTITSVFILFAVGILASWYPKHASNDLHLSGILPQTAIRNVAKLGTTILIPCLGFYSLGSSLTIDIVKEAWPMILWTPVQFIACGIVATALFKLLCIPPRYFTEFFIGCIFTNVVSMPLVMMEVLCDQEDVQEGDDCFDRAASFIFLPVMSWIFIFWTIGLTIIRYIHTNTTPTARKICKSLASPAVVANFLALIVVFIPSLQHALFDADGSLSFIISPIRILSKASVGVMSLLMAITLGKSVGGPQKLKEMTHTIFTYLSCKGAKSSSYRSNVINTPTINSTITFATNDVLLRSFSSQIQQTEENVGNEGKVEIVSSSCSQMNGDEKQSATMNEDNGGEKQDFSATASSPKNTNTAQENEKQGEENEQQLELKPIGDGDIVFIQPFSDANSDKGKAWPVLILIFFIFISMVILPLVRLGLLFFVGDWVFSGPNKNLIMLVLGIQSLTPTANIVVALCQQLGARLMAERISRAVLFQYLFGVAPLLVFTALTIGLIYS
eukprot:m.23698 g.23698  ORF g.23698 m.23698 type:complete len:528 (+) comp5574_c0_seq1:201-1784(+)